MSFLKNKKIRIFSGIGIDAFGSLIAQITGIAVIPFYLNYISANEYGTWLAISSTISLILIFDLPLEQYVTTKGVGETFYSKHFNEELSVILGIKIITSILFFIFSLFVYFYLPLFLNKSDHYLVHKIQDLVFLSILALSFNGFISIFYGLLNSQNEFHIVNSMTATVLTLQSVIPLILMTFGFQIQSFFYSAFLISFLNLIILFLIIYVKYKHFSLIPHFNKISLKDDIIKYTLSFQAIRWLTLFRTQFITILLNKFLGGAVVTVYNMTNRLPLTLSGYSSKISLPFLPILSELDQLGSQNEFCNIFLNICRILARIGLSVLIIGLFFNSNFVSLWVGPQLRANNIAEFFILLTMFFNIVLSCFGIVIFSTKNYGKWVYFSAAEMLLASLLSYFLKDVGLTGVLFAFFVGFSITNLYIFLHVLNMLEISFNHFFKRVILYSFKCNITILVSTYFAMILFDTYSWLGLFKCGLFVLFFGVILYELFTYVNKRGFR